MQHWKQRNNVYNLLRVDYKDFRTTRRSGVFIINFELISIVILEFQLLSLN